MTRVVVKIDRLLVRSSEKLDQAAFAADLSAELVRRLAVPGCADRLGLLGTVPRIRADANPARSEMQSAGLATLAGTAICREMLR